MRRPDCPWRRPHGPPRASRGRHGGRARPRVFRALNGSTRTVTAWSTRARVAPQRSPDRVVGHVERVARDVRRPDRGCRVVALPSGRRPMTISIRRTGQPVPVDVWDDRAMAQVAWRRCCRGRATFSRGLGDDDKPMKPYSTRATTISFRVRHGHRLKPKGGLPAYGRGHPRKLLTATGRARRENRDGPSRALLPRRLRRIQAVEPARPDEQTPARRATRRTSCYRANLRAPWPSSARPATRHHRHQGGATGTVTPPTRAGHGSPTSPETCATSDATVTLAVENAMTGVCAVGLADVAAGLAGILHALVPTTAPGLPYTQHPTTRRALENVAATRSRLFSLVAGSVMARQFIAYAPLEYPRRIPRSA